MSEYTKGKWKLHRGWSDWNLPCQHDIFVGNDDEPDSLIACIPSITPSAIGASSKDRDYQKRQWANAQLLVCAPEMAEMLLDLYNGRKTNGDIDALLKKAGVIE